MRANAECRAKFYAFFVKMNVIFHILVRSNHVKHVDETPLADCYGDWIACYFFFLFYVDGLFLVDQFDADVAVCLYHSQSNEDALTVNFLGEQCHARCFLHAT